jgi:LPS-assembly lipoprotein
MSTRPLVARPLALAALLACIGLPGLAGCVYHPLYGTDSYASQAPGSTLSFIEVADVDTRVGQQVRNHLIFLLNGGRQAPEPRYEAHLRVNSFNQLYAANRNYADTTAGTVTVNVSYDIVDLASHQQISNGRRVGRAAYDRTGQSFANERAQRDAENRAAQNAAEQIRLAIAADMSKR